MEGQGSTTCTEGRKEQTAHQAACTPAARSPRPTCRTGEEAARGRCRRQHEEQCKLLKHLTHWKDPEDGFAQTTNASLQKGQASSYPGQHSSTA